MKLRFKFFLIYSLISIIPLSAITYFSFLRYHQTIVSHINNLSDTLYHNAVDAADNMLDRLEQAMNFLNYYSNEGDASVIETLKEFTDTSKYSSYDILKAKRYCNSIFQNLMLTNENIHGIYVFTPNGISFSSDSNNDSQLAVNYDPRSDKWYQNTLALKGSLYISTIIDTGMFLDRQPSIYFSRSIRDVYTHKELGVILIDCSPQLLNLDNVNSIPQDALLYISNTETNETLYSNVDDLKNTFERSPRKIYKSSLTTAPLELTACFNQNAMLSAYNPTFYFLLAIVGVCFIGDLILTYFVTKTLIRPLEKLSKVMALQNKHSLSFYDPYMNRTDEIGTLYNEYSNMLEELNTSIKKDYKDKLILMDAQMKSLEARINSHFLFNTLESINSMAELDDNEQISTMSLALGRMFRYSIKTQSELVSLEDELRHVEDYNSIQQIRFSHRYSLDIHVPDSLRSCRVLKLILQPLVENALYHGLAYCTKGDRITILSEVKERLLRITVSDNGQGIPPDTLDNLKKSLQEEAEFTELGHRNKQSIGLKNIHTRIELYYGKGYGLFIESTAGRGTSVSIRLPLLDDITA